MKLDPYTYQLSKKKWLIHIPIGLIWGKILTKIIWFFFSSNFLKFESSFWKIWKIDPFIYKILHKIRGHWYTRRLIMLPMLAAHPRKGLLYWVPPGNQTRHLLYCLAWFRIPFWRIIFKSSVITPCLHLYSSPIAYARYIGFFFTWWGTSICWDMWSGVEYWFDTYKKDVKSSPVVSSVAGKTSKWPNFYKEMIIAPISIQVLQSRKITKIFRLLTST